MIPRRALSSLGLLAFALSAAPAWAVVGNLTVVVTDAGQPVPGATVTLQLPSGPATGVTDARGEHTFRQTEEGEYDVVIVWGAGNRRETRKAMIRGGQTTRVEIQVPTGGSATGTGGTDPAAWTGLYVGVHPGYGWTDDDSACESFSEIEALGFVGDCTADLSGPHVGFVGGFGITRHIAVQGGFDTFGSVKLDAQASGPRSSTFTSDGRFDPRGIFVEGIGWLPVGDNVRVGAGIGLVRWTSETSDTIVLDAPGDHFEESFSADNSGTSPIFSAMLEFMRDRIGFGLVFRHTRFTDDDPDADLQVDASYNSLSATFRIGFP